MSSPAELAAERCLEQVLSAVQAEKNFRLEAGAGAGKTYSLIKALQFVVKHKGEWLAKNKKRVACITYTTVARDEIKDRVDNDPCAYVETIHAFCWALLSPFQKAMRDRLSLLGDKWVERLAESEHPIDKQIIIYSLGYPKVTETEIFLHHNDVITFMSLLLELPKFRSVLTAQFPILFIDEYQDTSKLLAGAIKKHFLDAGEGPTIGLFGDHWQKIYRDEACGLIEAAPDRLLVIGKNANFRSDNLIVSALNIMRPELTQEPHQPEVPGTISVFHSNMWVGTRRPAGRGGHWLGDLPENEAHLYLEKTKGLLTEQGWDFNSKATKILMLTNNVLATEQGYMSIRDLFRFDDDYLKKGDSYIAFFIDVIDQGLECFKKKHYGEMFKVFGGGYPRIVKHNDKSEWNNDLNTLIGTCESGTIGDVIELLKKTRRPRLPFKIEEKEQLYERIKNIEDKELGEEEVELKIHLNKFRAIKFAEVKALANYLNDKTPFSTKHGVKGAEFDNVLVVLGRGWNQYNWNELLEFFETGVPNGREDAFERNRNLFYVSTSRPIHNLALLFTQKLSDTGLRTLARFYGSKNIIPLTL